MNHVLKKKALTAILTAALVFGIGGMTTDTFSVHEHELGIAHAAAEKVAHWRCYWCGKTATTKASHSGMGAKIMAGCLKEEYHLMYPSTKFYTARSVKRLTKKLKQPAAEAVLLKRAVPEIKAVTIIGLLRIS